jgi:sugar lactone lactonase YvrE
MFSEGAVMRRHLITCAIAAAGAAMVLSGLAVRARAAESDSLRVLFHGYVDRHGRAATAIVGTRGISDVRTVPFPDGAELSPDGRRVALDSCKRSERAIAIASVDGSGGQLVAPVDGEACVTVRWSRDGGKLSYTGGYDLILHVIDLETGADIAYQSTFLTASFHARSPDGSAIVYAVGRGGTRRIDVIELSTSRTHTLVGPEQFGACEVWGPDWAPVGNRIAFTACDGRLFTVNADGTGLTQVHGLGSAYAPRWSPDGRTLYFLSTGTLMRIADGGRPRAVAHLPFTGGPFSLAPVD